MKRVVINQSNYLPWKGYFDLMHDADVFVFLDNVQFTKNDWRNRNRIKTPHGPQWLSVPVGRSLDRLISGVTLADPQWQARHWKTLTQVYGRAPHFARYRELFEHVYLERRWSRLSELNQWTIRRIAELLGINVTFADAATFAAGGTGQERVLNLLAALEADVYVSGPSAQAYLDPPSFAARGVQIHWKDYSGYPEYPQLHPPFEHAVSIVDLLFNTGPDAPYYVWGWRQ